MCCMCSIDGIRDTPTDAIVVTFLDMTFYPICGGIDERQPTPFIVVMRGRRAARIVGKSDIIDDLWRRRHYLFHCPDCCYYSYETCLILDVLATGNCALLPWRRVVFLLFNCCRDWHSGLWWRIQRVSRPDRRWPVVVKPQLLNQAVMTTLLSCCCVLFSH